MDLNLKDRVALVTGGSHGLGEAICLGLAAEGANVAVNYRRNPEIAETLVNEIKDKHNVKAAAVLGSVTSRSNIIGMFDRTEKELGPVDILINNAAVCPSSFVKDMTEDEWNSTLQINLTGTFLTCKEMVNRLLSGGRTGKIINISSIAAFTGSTSGRSHYDASKGGVISFSISLAREVAADGIAVNVVAPGLMITKMTADRLNANRDKYLSRIPVGRFGETSEIANVVVFLASDRASYITGSTVNVSGGLLMR
jgi:3-oxoacyl-[acyl-carrier protein] reductase